MKRPLTPTMRKTLQYLAEVRALWEQRASLRQQRDALWRTVEDDRLTKRDCEVYAALLTVATTCHEGWAGLWELMRAEGGTATRLTAALECLEAAGYAEHVVAGVGNVRWRPVLLP